jgi:hydrogenase nickel incorporation protein HypB
MGKKKIKMIKDIYSENTRTADLVRTRMKASGLLSVNILGSPGTGKTSVILRLAEHLRPLRLNVIEGDVESDIDTKTLRKNGIPAFQINTFGGCHLDSVMMEKAMGTPWFRKASLHPGFLFIENIGNLICPAEFDLGEHIRLLISSVTEGSDKPFKYPMIFRKADIILLNKIDLAGQLGFDRKEFMKGIRLLNRKATVFEVSARSDAGFVPVAGLLEKSFKTL